MATCLALSSRNLSGLRFLDISLIEQLAEILSDRAGGTLNLEPILNNFVVPIPPGDIALHFLDCDLERTLAGAHVALDTLIEVQQLLELNLGIHRGGHRPYEAA